jgi:hypothetical protein
LLYQDATAPPESYSWLDVGSALRDAENGLVIRGWLRVGPMAQRAVLAYHPMHPPAAAPAVQDPSHELVLYRVLG